jgi:hypothetical protein
MLHEIVKVFVMAASNVGFLSSCVSIYVLSKFMSPQRARYAPRACVVLQLTLLQVLDINKLIEDVLLIAALLFSCYVSQIYYSSLLKGNLSSSRKD